MKKILIIEDNADSAEILSMLLEFHGHSVCRASSGTSGIALAQTFNPDVVISDLGLPDMNGMDLIRRLVANKPDCCSIIVLTGRSDVETRERAKLAGVDHFFAKGDQVTGLLALINK